MSTVTGHRSNGAGEKVCSGQESNTSGAKESACELTKLLAFRVLFPLAVVLLLSSGAQAVQSCDVEGHSGQGELVSDSI